MRQPTVNPRLFAAHMACACLASFIIGLALPLPSPRFALVDTQSGAVLAQGMTAQACRALLDDYPQGMARACR